MKYIKNCLFIMKKIRKFHSGRIKIFILNLLANYVEGLIFNLLFVPFVIHAIDSDYSWEIVLVYCSGMCLVLFIVSLFKKWQKKKYLPYSNNRINMSFQKVLLNKAEKIDLKCYGNTDFYNDFIWVLKDMDERAVKVLETIFYIFDGLIMFITVVVIMSVFDPVLFLFAIAPVLISVIFSIKINKVNIKYDGEKIPQKRKQRYTKRLFYLPEYTKEFRIYNIADVVQGIFNSAVRKLINITNKFGYKLAILNSGKEILNNVISFFLVFLYLAYRVVVTESISPGSVMLLSSSVWQLTARLEEIMEQIPRIQEHSLYIDNYKRFLNYENEIKENPEGVKAKKKANSLRVENLYFSYDDNEDYVLKDINMEIKGGETIAIVGHNGAGKTTLVNLLMNLYQPTKGDIYMDGIHMTKYNLESYRKRFGTVFQDYQLYAASIMENIYMDKIDESDIEKQKQAVKALKKSGLYKRIEKTSRGIDSEVTREFSDNGLVFSGGQKQKLALARLFVRKGGVVILDEPSSSLDPISESEMYKNMMKVTEDKTVVMISHHLGTTVGADRIYLLEQGEIIEKGTHEQLMELDKKYAFMFKLQSEKYKQNNYQYI